VGKSALALTVLRQRGIPWLSTDTVRTVLRQVVPAIDEVDAGFPSADALATVMHPFIEQTIGVCLAQSPDYLIEGVEILPADIAGYRERFGETRSCFLGHGAMSTDDLRRYQGNNPWHEGYGQAELERLAG
jgi:2-phosphoglycerate kinase